MSKKVKNNEVDNNIKAVRDRPIKSIIKSITWRIIASGTTFALAMIFFRNDPQAIQKATGIAIIESFVKMFFYFLHERAWAQLRWGKMMVIIRKNRRKSLISIHKLFKKF